VGAGVLHLVNLLEFLIFLIANSGIHQNRPGIVLDQQATQGERNPVLRVRDNLLFPEGLGNNAEHGAAVEMLPTAFEQVAGKPSYPEPGVQLHSSPMDSGRARRRRRRELRRRRTSSSRSFSVATPASFASVRSR
jgi:hypothetical protein